MTLRAAIIGTGNIGTDLLLKSRKSNQIKVTHFIGRRIESPGIVRARSIGIATMTGGLEDLMSILDDIDVIFDATSAADHLLHNDALKSRNVLLINLTPAKVGEFFVPGAGELTKSDGFRNINMVTCGGQTAIPIISDLVSSIGGAARLLSVELVSTLASASAGPATRRNIDEYVQNTQRAISSLTGVKSKVVLVLNPAKPEIIMRSSIYFEFADPAPDVGVITESIKRTNLRVKKYCPGYLIEEDVVAINNLTVKVCISVESTSEFFPIYAGNLDIINTAAIVAAESLSLMKVDQ